MTRLTQQIATLGYVDTKECKCISYVFLSMCEWGVASYVYFLYLRQRYH